MKLDSVGIVGGGAWGTALAQSSPPCGARRAAVGAEPETSLPTSTKSHVNDPFLPGVALDPAIPRHGETLRCDAAAMRS